MSVHLLDDLYRPDSQSLAIRPPTPQEDTAIFMFANHARHCTRCADPMEANLSTGMLCDLGTLFAWELAKYLYAREDGAYSLIDRQRSGQRVQIDLPPDCLVILRLFKAVKYGLTMGQSSLTHGVGALG